MRAFRLFLQTVGLLTVVAIVATAIGLPFLGNWLHRQDQPEKSDYIIVLAGNNERVVYAIELYHQGYSPKLLIGLDRREPITGRLQRVLDGTGSAAVDYAEFVARSLKFLNVPPEASEIYGRELLSTYDEALALRRFVGDRRFSAILVTSAFHTRRAKMVFEHVLPHGRFRVVAPPEETMVRWWADARTAVPTVTESAKMMFFFIGGAFRSVVN